MWKKHKVVVLPANGKTYKSGVYFNGITYTRFNTSDNRSREQHLYILSDDEIILGDCYLNQDNIIYQSIGGLNKEGYIHCKKVIASTNKSFNLLPISNKFLQQWVNNPVDEIEIEYYHGIETSLVEVNYVSGDKSLNWKGINNLRDIKITDNTINCRFIESEETWDDIQKGYEMYLDLIKDIEFIDWLKERYQVPKQIK